MGTERHLSTDNLAPFQIHNPRPARECSLAAAPGHAVGLDELSDALWNGSAPASARAAIQNQISRIRVIAGSGAITTEGGAYRFPTPRLERGAVGRIDDLCIYSPTRAGSCLSGLR